MSDKITLSVIKADVGGFVGHTTVHPEIIGAAKEQLASAVGRSLQSIGVTADCARFEPGTHASRC